MHVFDAFDLFAVNYYQIYLSKTCLQTLKIIYSIKFSNYLPKPMSKILQSFFYDRLKNDNETLAVYLPN